MVPSDSALLTSFIDLSLPAASFSHREHVRLAWIILKQQPDFAVAAGRFIHLLRRYVAHVGAAEKYHETITWAYLALVREAMQGCDAASSEAFLAQHPALLDHQGGALARRYDLSALLADPLARSVFVLPRRAP